jgi:serine protease
MISIQEANAAIANATLQPGADFTFVPARFALLLRQTDDPVAKRQEIEDGLKLLDPNVDVRPLSSLESRILIAEFPDRTFGVDDGQTFAAAYTLAEAFDLKQAEPDLPTDFFPQPSQSGATKDPVEESVAGFGCFTAAQPELNDRPRWALNAMRVAEAWSFSEQRQRPDRGASIVIAQPDTGITNHPELAEVAQTAPRDILGRDDNPTDPLEDGPLQNPGHGTGTASVVVSPETRVIAGSAPRAMHMPIRAIRSVLRISQVTVAEAIEWAVAHGAHVITMSLGGIPSFSLHRAVRRAVAADVIVLAAAGNCVRTVVWPARYDDCIAVAGVNSNDAPWRGTCRGAAVSISAPGENVFRARSVRGEEPSVGQGQGTSFAVALTAGVAALWLAHHGRANLIAAAHARRETLQEMFRRLLKATARRPAGWDSFNMGAGIVDARALLEADFDAGRDRESAPQPDDAVAREEIAVQSFVLETVGADALQDDLDWNRFGPEIATAVLRQRLLGADAGALRAEAPAAPASLSPELAQALQSPALRQRLGI